MRLVVRSLLVVTALAGMQATCQYNASSPISRVMRPAIAYAADKQETTPVSRCVDVDQSETEGGLDVKLSNDCDRSVTCGVRWTVSCEGAKGKRSLPGTRSLRMETSGKADVKISAAGCGSDSWTIEDLAWKCDPA
jgi:hypothetical protein